MNLLRISKAYLSNKNKTGLAKLHSYISIFGIMFGIAALIVVNASMKGFSEHLVNKLSPFSDVTITLDTKISQPVEKALYNEILKDSNIIETFHYEKLKNEYHLSVNNKINLETFYIMKSDFNLKDDVVYFSDSYKNAFLNWLIRSDLSKTREEAIKELEDTYVSIDIKDSKENVIDQTILKLEFDKRVQPFALLISKETFNNNIFVEELKTLHSMYSLNVEDKLNADEIANYYESKQSVLETNHWLSGKEKFLSSLKLEQLLIKIVLFFILLVSCFNIVSTMTLIITEKKQDIYLLKTIGYSNNNVLSIFLISGLWYGLIGMLSGTALGLLITNNLTAIFSFFESLFAIQLIPIDEGLPYSLLVKDICYINLFTFVIVILASLFPSLNTLKMKPAEGLRDE